MGCGGCLLAPGSCIKTQYSTGYVTAGMSVVPYLRCVFVRYAIGMSLSGVSFTCALLGLFSSRCVSVRCVIPMCPCFLCHFTCHCQVCHFICHYQVCFLRCAIGVPFTYIFVRCFCQMCHSYVSSDVPHTCVIVRFLSFLFTCPIAV